MLLRDLPPLLREEPGFASVLGRSSAVLAVPEPARALFIAGLATLRSRRPIVVAVPTTGEAERLAHDLRTFLGADDVELFPAWETLPFERVSPSLETMGRRLRVMWRLRDPARAPRRGRRAGAGARAAARPARRGRRAGRRPARASGVDRDELVERLVGAGLPARVPGRAPRRGRRPRLDRRRVPVHRRPPGAHRPLGRRGRPAHRVRGRRPALHPRRRPSVEIFPAAASCSPPPRCASGPQRLVAREPWGREQWERLAEGQTFDGMESWLPWLTEGEHLLPDLSARRALVLLVEPRRMRDRAAELLDEEADLAATLATTWGDDGAATTTGSRACTCPFDRLLAHTDAPALDASRPRPRAPTSPPSPPTGVDPVGRRPASASCRQLAELAGRGLPRRARRRRRRARPRAPPRRCSLDADGDRARRDRRSRPLERGVVLPARQAGRDRRGRPHRPSAGAPPAARPQRGRAGLLRRPQARRLRRAPPARRRPATRAW